MLIDWDTVGLTRPERDLWWFADDAGALARYAEQAGRVPDPKAITLYRDAWIVSDLESMLHVFRSAHVEDDDTRHEWQSAQWSGVGRGSRRFRPQRMIGFSSRFQESTVNSAVSPNATESRTGSGQSRPHRPTAQNTGKCQR